MDSLKFSIQIRKKGLKAVYKMCGRNKLLPKSLQIPLCYDRRGFPLYTGGFADVWKGEYRGQDVAVKVIRIPSHASLQKDLQKIIGVCCTIFLHVGALAELRIEVLQGGRNVEITSASKRAAADGSNDD